MTEQIEASLRRRGIEKVCHFTPCDRLPDIVRHGLLSLAERQRRGITEPDLEHFWGTPGKKEALADFVICSFMPPWGMIRSHEEEIAIITLDAGQVCCAPGVAFCPGNSAFNEYPADAIRTWTGGEKFDACFQNERTYQAGTSEIFVPGRVPLAAFRDIVFFDAGSRAYWGNKLSAVDTQEELPPNPVKLWDGGIQRFTFPGGWQPTRRVRS